jgi:hypothetical protein
MSSNQTSKQVDTLIYLQILSQLFSWIYATIAQAAYLVYIDSPRPKIEKGLSPPAIERQIHNTSRIDQLPNGGCACGDKVNVRSYRDAFAFFPTRKETF